MLMGFTNLKIFEPEFFTGYMQKPNVSILEYDSFIYPVVQGKDGRVFCFSSASHKNYQQVLSTSSLKHNHSPTISRYHL